METERSPRVAFSPMNMIAGVSAVALMGTIAWSSLQRDTANTPIFARAALPTENTQTPADYLMPELSSGATSSTPLGDAVLGQFATRYTTLSQSGMATDAAATDAANIVPTITAPLVAESSIATTPDTSLERVIKYRADLRVALAPLLNNTSPELDIYAQWIQTGDESYLKKLESIAADYDSALSQAKKVTTPLDAVHYQAGILNAMAEFSAALRALSANAKDPIASLTLLRTYNMAEQHMFTAFNSLAVYAAAKTQ